MAYQGSTGDDASATGQEVASDNVLEDGGLATGLRTNDDDLGQVDGVVDSDGGEGILQLVDGFD